MSKSIASTSAKRQLRRVRNMALWLATNKMSPAHMRLALLMMSTQSFDEDGNLSQRVISRLVGIKGQTNVSRGIDMLAKRKILKVTRSGRVNLYRLLKPPRVQGSVTDEIATEKPGGRNAPTGQ